MSSRLGRGCAETSSPALALPNLLAWSTLQASRAGCWPGQEVHAGARTALRKDCLLLYFFYRLSFFFLPQLLPGMILEDNLTWSLFSYPLLLKGWSISPGRRKQPYAWITLKYTCAHVKQLGIEFSTQKAEDDFFCFPPVTLGSSPPPPSCPAGICPWHHTFARNSALFLLLPVSWDNFCTEKGDLIEKCHSLLML